MSDEDIFLEKIAKDYKLDKIQELELDGITEQMHLLLYSLTFFFDKEHISFISYRLLNATNKLKHELNPYFNYAFTGKFKEVGGVSLKIPNWENVRSALLGLDSGSTLLKRSILASQHLIKTVNDVIKALDNVDDAIYINLRELLNKYLRKLED